MANFVPLTGFSSALQASYGSDDFDLPLTSSFAGKIADRLSEGNYTYLTISDETEIEIVKVTKSFNSLAVVRGQEGTEARAFPKGSCVRFSITAQAVRDIVCQMECCPEPLL